MRQPNKMKDYFSFIFMAVAFLFLSFPVLPVINIMLRTVVAVLDDLIE